MRRRRARRDQRPYRPYLPYLFIAPFFALFLPFGAGSVLLAAGMSFADWPIGASPTFSGIDNYKRAIDDPVFGTALGNTTTMLLSYLALLLPVCLVVAVGLGQLRARTRNAVQILVFIPVTMSLIAVSMVFDLLYNENLGFINQSLARLGVEPIGFLSDPALAPWSIVVLRVWRVVGYYAIILFAGLQAIPVDLYEAAQIDGAGPWRRFWNITLPLLRPVTMFVLVAASIAAWELFAEPQVLTEGGPARSTLTAVMYIYQASFLEFDLGKGAASSVLLALLIITTTLVITRLLRSKTDA
ncbi:carbohydrate ABC transporter permease [Plantactinospora sp. CA-294935]|uniref:carbohydrate ABC transporter permease n=1 Tax=Plantactinospora sp. CA-294935 TaxID=3240012 RepID=UPI003D91B6F1